MNRPRMFKWNYTPAETIYPYNLNPEDLEYLQALTNERSFKIFISLLKDIAEYNGETILNTQGSTLHRRQGYIQALRDIINLIPLILQQAKAVDASRTNAQSLRNGTTDQHSGTGFLGSPWWDLRNRISKSDR